MVFLGDSQLNNFFASFKRIRWTGTLIVALVALVLSGLLGGFYISDTVSGRGTALGAVLKVVGFCPVDSVGKIGATGKTGATGPSGPPGPSGAPGKDATVEPVPNQTAIPGKAGANGSTGSTGSTGATGSTGSTGSTGETGATGSTGATGATGAAGTCSVLDTASLAGDLLPAADNTYSLGTLAKRWKSLQLGPGTLYITDTQTGNQAGITIEGGVMLIDGVDSLRLGNVRFTNTGITSLLPDQNLTIGSLGDTGWTQVAHGILFPDTTTLTSANGMTGPRGLPGADGAKGDIGATGPQGPAGNIGDYVETKACMYTGRPNNTPTGTLMIGTCAELGQEGNDIQILIKR
jgi:hypothetical protein